MRVGSTVAKLATVFQLSREQLTDKKDITRIARVKRALEKVSLRVPTRIASPACDRRNESEQQRPRAGSIPDYRENAPTVSGQNASTGAPPASSGVSALRAESPAWRRLVRVPSGRARPWAGGG